MPCSQTSANAALWTSEGFLRDMRSFQRGLRASAPKISAGARTRSSTSIARRSLSGGFWSWLSSKNEAADALRNKALKAHINPDGTILPMLESPIKELRDLAQQYAGNGKGCGSCSQTKIFSCPQSGFPTHCTKECYDDDPAYKEVKSMRTHQPGCSHWRSRNICLYRANQNPEKSFVCDAAYKKKIEQSMQLAYARWTRCEVTRTLTFCFLDRWLLICE
jgi:hypothetical protein